MGAVIKVLVYAAAVWVAVELVPGLDYVADSPVWLLAIALVLGVTNAVLRPLLRALSFPLVLASFGLFVLVVNVVVLAAAIALSEALDLGLVSDGVPAVLLGAVVVSVVTWGLETFLRRG